MDQNINLCIHTVSYINSKPQNSIILFQFAIVSNKFPRYGWQNFFALAAVP